MFENPSASHNSTISMVPYVFVTMKGRVNYKVYFINFMLFNHLKAIIKYNCIHIAMFCSEAANLVASRSASTSGTQGTSTSTQRVGEHLHSFFDCLF